MSRAADGAAPRYGYIGLGSMGAAMAEHLIASANGPVTVFDIDRAAVAAAVSRGAVAADHPAGVAAAADVVSVCVPAAEHIEAVFHGPDGIAEGAHEGLTLLVHSTVHPDTIRDAAARAETWGVAVNDACVAGGADLAKEGRQLLLVGGLGEMAPEARALVDIYAETVIDAGFVGGGAALKIALNVMTYAQFTAAATAFDLLSSAGVDPSKVFDGWKAIGQLGALTERYRMLLDIPPEHLVGAFRAGLATQVGIAEKDLALALELGESRLGTREFLQALHDAMSAVYGLGTATGALDE